MIMRRCYDRARKPGKEVRLGEGEGRPAGPAQGRRRLSIRQLDAFHAAAQTGSVTEAAKLLGVSQPGISRLIASLEWGLGLALFERRRKRLFLTPEGRLFMEELERTSLGLDRLERAANDIKQLKRGHLRIASLPALSLSVVPEALARFLQAYPDLKVSASVQPSQQVVDSVAARHVDVGIAQPTGARSEVRAVATFGADCVCALPPDHRLLRQDVVRPEDLAGEALIALPPHTPAGRGIDRAFKGVGLLLSPNVETFISMTACALVAEGVGIALVDPFTAASFGDRRIATRPFLPSVKFDVQIVVHESGAVSRPAAEFVRILQECFSKTI